MSPTDIASAPTPGERTAGVVVGILAWMDGHAWLSWASPDATGGAVISSGLRRASGLGYGDVKLAAVIAGCAGYTSLSAAAAALMAGFLAAGVAAGVLLVGGAGRGSAMAMGRGCCWVPPLPWPTTAERQQWMHAAPATEVAAMPTHVAAHRRGAGRARPGRSQHRRRRRR